MSVSIEARPILKWAGGKQAIASRLVAKFPASMAVYYEPFVGGASVLASLARRRRSSAT